MTKFNWLIIALLCFSVKAQELLTLDKALELGLSNNYAILISKNLNRQSQYNYSKGNAGMLPSINLNLDGQLSNTSIKQEFVTGNEVDNKSSQSKNLHSDISVKWTIYDGLKMFHTLDKLKHLNELSKYQLHSEMEDLSLAIMENYFQLVIQAQLLKSNEYFIQVYKNRLMLEESRLRIGTGSKNELLSAKIDFNKQLELRSKFQAQEINLKIELQRKMCTVHSDDFIVEDSIPFDEQYIISELEQLSYNNNAALIKAELDQQIKQNSLNEIKSERYPNLSLNAGYAINRVDNQAGFLLYNQNHGWNAGLSSTWNLFNGSYVNRAIKNAKLDLENSKLKYNLLQSDIKRTLENYINEYNTARRNRSLNNETRSFAEEYLKIQIERYQLGECTALEFNESQQKLQDAIFAVFQSEYEAKIAELNLRKQLGILIKRD